MRVPSTAFKPTLLTVMGPLHLSILYACLFVGAVACASVPDGTAPPESPSRPSVFRPSPAAQLPKGVPALIDPGFEAFSIARAPIFGWYSDDVVNPSDPRMARVTMLADVNEYVEGRSSLRIEQAEPRPVNRGYAFLAQTIRLPEADQPHRRFNLSFAARGDVTGPLTVDVYVWDPKYVAHQIASRAVHVTMAWARATQTFDVPLGHSTFGIWFYLPAERGVRVWIDDVQIALADG
jgi:hypothetical protein